MYIVVSLGKLCDIRLEYNKSVVTPRAPWDANKRYSSVQRRAGDLKAD